MSLRTPSAVLAATALVLAAGCQPFWLPVLAGVSGSGRSASATRQVGPFTSILNAGAIDLSIEIGPEQSVVLEGDDNLLPLIRTEVADGQLVVTTEESYNSRLGLRAKIRVPALVALRIDGSGDASLSGVAGDRFALSIHGSGDVTASGSAAQLEVEVNGSGDVRFTGLAAREIGVAVRGSGDVALDGTAETLRIRVHGSGDVDAAGLRVRSANADLHGSGDARVTATESVSGRLHGSGDLVYAGGAPRVSVDRHGSGDAVPR